jgi:signal peptide peptidase SppA
MIRALDAALSAIWTIREESLQTILQIASLSVEERGFERVQAVAAQLGRRLDNTRTVVVREGVAVIPVTGPLFRHADMFSEISGAVSTETIAADFKTALGDPNVRSIVFDIDSPGGEASGVDDLATLIYEARGQKPIEAYVSGMAASGAYWIASACDRITLSPASQVGSIGVVAAYRDYSEQEAKKGIKTVQYVSSQSPNKRPDPNTEAGKSEMQRRVDDIASVFISEVAKHRNVTPEHVSAKFGAGGLLVGEKSIEVRAADRVGTFDHVMAALTPEPSLGLGFTPLPGGNKLSDNWFTRLFASMNNEERAKAAEALGTTSITATLDTTQPSGADAELNALKAQLAQMQRDQAKTQATAFIKDAVINGRMMPAEDADAFVAAYVQASQDDAANPIPGFSRVEALSKTITSRPSHGLFTERVKDSTIAVIPTTPSVSDDLEQVKAQARAYAEKINGRRK